MSASFEHVWVFPMLFPLISDYRYLQRKMMARTVRLQCPWLALITAQLHCHFKRVKHKTGESESYSRYHSR